MSSWWKSATTTNLTRGLTSITGQLSNNLKDILTEASEETFDPSAELERARGQIEDLEFRKQALIEENASLKKQCDELLMQKQAVEIKSDMLLAESRRTIDEKDTELKRLRENVNAVNWNTTKDLNNTWTDILEDDQPEISEYLKYQKMIRDFKDENNHLRDELVTLRKNLKSQQNEKNQSRHQEELLELEKTYTEQLSKCRAEYEEKLRQVQSRLDELEHSHSTIETKEQMDDVDKDLLSQELEQANEKLRWFNEKFHFYSELEEKFALLTEQHEQLQREKSEEFRSSKENREDREQQTDLDDQFERLFNEERQRCDALAADYESICQILEQTRTKLMEMESEMKTRTNQNEKLNEENETLLHQLEQKDRWIEEEKRRVESLEEEIHRKEKSDDHLKEVKVREMLELNENLQLLENEKFELQQELDDLRDQLRSKERSSSHSEPIVIPPGSPSMDDVRAVSPSPSTFERVIELEGEILRHEEIFRELNTIYHRFVELLPNGISSNESKSMSLADRYVQLFEQWSNYIETFSITQQECDTLKQLLIEKQDDLEKLQADLDLTTMKLVEMQEEQHQSQLTKNSEEHEEEMEEIFDLHRFPPRAESRQSFISSTTPGEKQQLIAQNELLTSLLAEKERELVSSQQAEKSRGDLIKNIEHLQTSLQQMEIDQEAKQNELNDMRNVLDEKLRENSSLKKEKMYFIEKLAELERERQEQQSTIQVAPKQSIQEEEKSSNTTPTIDQVQNEEKVDEDQYQKLRAEYDQLLEFSKKQHEESVSYYNEYTRILALYNDLNSKQSQFQVDYESLQSLIQQKNEAYLQCQNELNNYQNLYYHEKKKSEEMEHLRSTLNEKEKKLNEYHQRETELLWKQSELEREMKLLEQNLFELKQNEQTMIEQIQQNNAEQMQLEIKRFLQERDLAIIEKKKVEQEYQHLKEKLSQFEERERKYNNEIERLRSHLLKMEESCTLDLLAAEEREKSLRTHIAELEDTNQAQKELIQQLNTSGEQSKQALATELGTLKYEFSKLESINQNLNQQLQYQLKCSQNLQNVLEQFKREREQHTNEHLRQYQDALREQTALATRLTNENNEIRTRLAEYNEALAAAQRLNDQMEKKEQLIHSLRKELQMKDQQIQHYEQNLRDLQSTSGSRVEKQLVKNILLSYFHTPVDKRQEVVPLLGALVGFTQDEYQKAVQASSTGRGGTGWLGGWLGGNQSNSNAARTRTQSETPPYDPNKSFTELLIQYVDQQSSNNPQMANVRFNTDQYLHRFDQNNSTTPLRNPSMSSSNNPFFNPNYPSINRPASAIMFPVSTNSSMLPPPPPPPLPPSSSSNPSETSSPSSTILKDLLKS